MLTLTRSLVFFALLVLAGCATAPRYAESAGCASMWFSASPYAVPLVITCALRDTYRELSAEEDDEDD